MNHEEFKQEQTIMSIYLNS